MNSEKELLAHYFDYAATTPPFPAALHAQSLAAQMYFGNPSAMHAPGRIARQALERYRVQLAALCGLPKKGHLLLTSGATEANNWVIHGIMSASRKGRILVAMDSHASVWNTAHRYANRVDTLSLNAQGQVTPAALRKAIKPSTQLVCCPHASNETGVIHDVAAFASVCARRKVLFHVDGAQTVGHIPVNVTDIGCDFYTFAAHKFGGPRGCGGVLIAPKHHLTAGGLSLTTGVTLCPPVDGGSQEWGLRPGTEDLAALAGTVVALRQSLAKMKAESRRLPTLVQALLTRLRTHRIKHVTNSSFGNGLPGLVSLSFPNVVDGYTIVARLGKQGLAIAAGSACSEGRPEPSRTIIAMGVSPEKARATIRVSFGRFNHVTRARQLGDALAKTVKSLSQTPTKSVCNGKCSCKCG